MPCRERALPRLPKALPTTSADQGASVPSYLSMSCVKSLSSSCRCAPYQYTSGTYQVYNKNSRQACLDVRSVQSLLQHLGSISELLVGGVVSALVRGERCVHFHPRDRLAGLHRACPGRQELQQRSNSGRES